MEEINYRVIYGDPDGMRYELMEDYEWSFAPLGWVVKLEKGMRSDGATSARDLGADETGWRSQWAKAVGWFMHSPIGKRTCAWYVHDQVCNTGRLADGRRVPNVVASIIICIALYRDGYKRECVPWFFATLFGGGGKARENGLLWLKKDANG